jgi:type II secretory pathway pseudopilin PulG
MENNSEISGPIKQHHRKRFFILSGAILIVTILAVTSALYWIYQYNPASEVKSALNEASAAMVSAAKDGGYPNSLPDSFVTNKAVKLTGAGSFDGTSFCIVGVSQMNNSIVYHIDSASKTPIVGDCESASDLPKLASTGALSVTFAGDDRIGLTWYGVPSATDYTLECAKDEKFSDGIVTKTTKEPTGVCDTLQSGTIYYARARANNQAGSGDWSAVISSTTSRLP